MGGRFTSHLREIMTCMHYFCLANTLARLIKHPSKEGYQWVEGFDRLILSSVFSDLEELSNSKQQPQKMAKDRMLPGLIGQKSEREIIMRKILVLLSAVCLAAGAANAQNLLLNGDFNDPPSGAAPTSWTPWSWNAGFANHEIKPGLDDSYCLVAGNGWYDGGGGFFQTISATAGTEYNLTVSSGADAWWLPTGRMTMFFLDSSPTPVELGQATRNTVDPAVYGQNYDIAHPWAAYSLTGTAPVGTTQIKVEFASNNPGGVGGAIYFDNASLTAVVPEPGAAALVALGSALLLGYRSRRNATRA